MQPNRVAYWPAWISLFISCAIACTGLADTMELCSKEISAGIDDRTQAHPRNG